ncbi:hypothetical protein BSKO_00282 [Bryopsis sp. KO-2023]|nr:hypothetical protein BSKO_00282 [Bryopsis sp. KO-2023]
MAFRYAYLHGFLSSPQSYKGLELQRRLLKNSLHMEILDMSLGKGCEGLTYSSGLQAITNFFEDTHHKGEKLRLVGSSLGGYISARYAELHPDRVDRIVLLNPGLSLLDRWPERLGEKEMHLWKKRGFRDFKRNKEDIRMPYDFIKDAERHPLVPKITRPTLILHGKYDEVIPIQAARDVKHMHPEDVTLIEMDDDHAMMKHKSLNLIEKKVVSFFGISQPT